MLAVHEAEERNGATNPICTPWWISPYGGCLWYASWMDYEGRVQGASDVQKQVIFRSKKTFYLREMCLIGVSYKNQSKHRCFIIRYASTGSWH